MSVSYSPDGNYIVSGSYDKTVKLWDKNSGKLIENFEHTDGVKSVKFSPDGNDIVSCTFDKKVKLWDKTKEKSI